jgi:hypothetical protein
MPNDWRIHESGEQALLHGVLSAVAESSPNIRAGIPRPLLWGERPEGEEDAKELIRLLRESEPAELDGAWGERCERILGRFADDPVAGRIAALPPWRTFDVVHWWLSAYESLRRWQHARISTAESSAEDGDSELAWRLLVEGADKWKVLQPVLWLDRWAGTFEIDTDSFRPWWDNLAARLGLDQRCLTKRHAEEALLVFTSDPRRRPSTLKAAEGAKGQEDWGDYVQKADTLFKPLPEACSELLGEPCNYATNPVPGGGDRWITMVSESPLAQFVRQPILCSDRLLVGGAVMAPAVRTLAARLRDLPHLAGSDSSLARAAAAARTGSRSRLKLSPFGSRINSTAALDEAVSLLATNMRLATFLWLDGESLSAGEGMTEAVRSFCKRFSVGFTHMLELERCQMRMEKSDPTLGRMISWAPLGPAAGGEPGKLVCVRDDRSFDVGVCGGPHERPLPEEFDDLDWRLWAVSAARMAHLDDAMTTLVRGVLLAVDEAGWEVCKRRLLTEPVSISALADMFSHLHAARMRLETPTVAVACGDFGREIVDRLHRCELVMLQALQQIDPEANGGLCPPRREDGTCDVAKWVADAMCSDSRGRDIRVMWRVDERPFGTQIEERLEPDGMRVVFSAAGMTPEDVRLLNSPFLVTCPSTPQGQFFEPLHRLGKFLCGSLGKKQPDVPAALSLMRKYLATDAGAQAFNALIHESLAGNRDALHWVELLRADERFAFSCHPAIDWNGTPPSPCRPRPDEPLMWQDDAEVPEGDTLEIVYAIDVAESRRVLSRGLPASDSAEVLAAGIARRVETLDEPVRLAGQALRDDTDRRRVFGDVVSHPMKHVCGLLAALVTGTIADSEQAAALFSDLVAWCKAVGHDVVPDSWQPELGSSVVPHGCEQVCFHATIPPGRCVVTTFGIRGSEEQAFEGYVSAGPAPAGFVDIATVAGALSAEVPRYKAIRECVAELPRHYLAGKAVLAGPNLYNAIWNAVVDAAPAADGEALLALTDGVRRLLEHSCGMTLFEPTQLGEYAAAWVRGPDGKPPRGSWIVRVIRPGVRTVRNTLVWPAVVETE